MKILSPLAVISVLTLLTTISCKKETTNPVTTNPVRKVQFSLYSDKDFSNDHSVITFRVSIQNTASQTLWDSVLAPMKLKDIPGLANKLVIEKTVPGNNASLLKVGFYYSIENVGYSWHLDSFNTGETFKVIDFNFR